MLKPVSLFYSYSHKDEELRNKLADHLAYLRRANLISEWHDRDIEAGGDWAREIDAKMASADIILLLISASFIASDYCWGVELRKALERHERQEAVVVPIILRPCRWQETPFAKLQASPSEGRPVTSWSDPDAALDDVADKIGRLVKAIRKRSEPVPATPSTAAAPAPDQVGLAPASFARACGEDLFGRWAEIVVPPKNGGSPAVRRLRWIEPGSFLMGSPKHEPGRISIAGRLINEGPRHRVTLTRGFWLGDTPCTQALWEAVMGDNPSRFRSADRPVEQVSWHDVQRFLATLGKRFPGCGARLPTEAEWEYACRAGTDTAIYTGDIAIHGERNAPALDPIAWYGGNSGVRFELANGENSSSWEAKQYPHTRAGTRPVGGKAPNRWGLYDMLGNVWEWCADGGRDYRGGPEVDPKGHDAADAPHAFRGGSWIDPARRVRSAYRYAAEPGDAVYSLGFRLSLRSIEPGPA